MQKTPANPGVFIFYFLFNCVRFYDIIPPDMRMLVSLFLVFGLILPASADILPLDDALRATYSSCVGIDDSLSDLKRMAGINTAVTGVGTAVNTGATVVGLVKASKDRDLEKLLEELRTQDESISKTELSDQEYNEGTTAWREFRKTNPKASEDEIAKLTKQSKILGNWRTGLLAGGAATNVAGAIIAGTNKADVDLQTQINNCKSAVKNLRDSIMQARMNGTDVAEANSIVAACGEYDYVDISSINKRGKGAMVSSIVGATTGAAGTVTSVIANTDATRNDNTDVGKQKEKNLNTASNVLAGASTVASATATVFNATQISAIKKVATVAEKCTGVLK